MTEIYLIRHTQAEGNLYHMMQGHWDGDITELGKKQIDALAERMRDVKIDALYTSDLYRTRMTASAITKYHDIPMINDERLREINIGPWEAVFFGNVLRSDPEIFKVFMGDPENFYLEGAETYSQVRDRSAAAVEEIAAKHDGEAVAVVSHGITIRCIISKLCGIPLNDTETLPIFKNTGIAHLFYENGKFTVDYLNDASHITEELMPRGGDPILRHEFLNPAKERRYYTDCYADAWKFAHGNLDDYNETIYFDSAKQHYEEDNGSIFKFYEGDTEAGLLDLDTRRGAHAGYGWISLLYLKPEYRRKGCSIQALGRALSKYKSMGRRSVRLHVAEDNRAAMEFYEKWGFKKLSREPGSSSTLWLMEKKL